MSAALLALLLAAAGPSGAVPAGPGSEAAASPRPTARRAPAPADAPLELLGKKRSAAPDDSLAGSLEAKGTAPAAKRPALALDDFRRQVEVEVAGKRREEISGLEELIRLGGSDAEVPGWLFRLGELHWEESQHLFFEANRKDDEALRSGADVARARALADEKRALEGRSRAEQEAAVARYLEIVRRYPRWPRMDEVLFFLGENLSRQRRPAQAAAAYKRLLVRFPSSRFVPDAWVALGEQWFDEAEKGDRTRRLLAAREAYRRASAAPESGVRGYALYKEAWVDYNLGEFRAALGLFEQVIAIGDAAGGALSSQKRLALGREARRDYVRTYSHVGQPQAAEQEFARVGGGDGREMLKQLAQLYYDEGKDRESILVHHRLVQRWPGAPDAPLFQSRIVTAAGRLGKKELAVQQAGKFVELVRAAERAGAAGDARQAEVLAAARREAENTLRTLAVQYHNEWRKTREPATAELAASLYRDHLALFPDGPRAYEMGFFHAELLFALGRFQEAGDAYVRVAALDPSARGGGPGRWLEDALEGAIFSYDAVLKAAPGQPAAAPGQPEAHARRPWTREERQLLDACLRYADRAPGGDKAVEAAYQAARLRYRHDELREAAALFARIALDHPRHPVAGYAANLLLDTENLLGDVRATGEWARRLYARRELLEAHPELVPDLVRVVEQSAFKLVEREEKAGRFGEAAKAYLAFATDWPGSALAPTALFDAAVDFVKAGDLPRAAAARRALWDRHPGHPLAARALLASGADAAALADFSGAADAYERYFAGWKAERERAARPRARRGGALEGPPPARRFEDRAAQDALHDAGVYREGLGDLARADADRRAFLAAFPDAKETAQVFRSVAGILERQRAFGRAVRQLEEYQRRFARAGRDWFEAQQWIAKLHEEAGDARAARRDRALALRRWRQERAQAGEAGQALAAGALVDELDAPFAEYERIGFAVPARRLAAQVALKGRRLLELQRRYTEVVKLEAAEPAVCALYRIGAGYQHFATALTRAPVPAELRGQAELAKEYRAQLAAQAAAPRQKAVEGLALAVQQARAHGVSNGCARQARAALAELDPAAAAPAPERVPWPSFDAPAGPAERARAEAEDRLASGDAPGERVRRGLARLALGDAAGAYALGRDAVAKDPRTRGAHALLARAALAQGRLDLAGLLALQAAKADPADPWVPLVQGRVLERRGDANAAAARWRRAAAGPGAPLLERELTRVALARESWAEVARSAGAVAAAEPGDAVARLALGVARRHLGKPDDALAAYAEAERLAGDALPEVHLARAVLLAQDRRACDAARTELERYLSLSGPAAAGVDRGRVLAGCEAKQVASSQGAGPTREERPAGAGKAP